MKQRNETLWKAIIEKKEKSRGRLFCNACKVIVQKKIFYLIQKCYLKTLSVLLLHIIRKQKDLFI